MNKVIERDWYGKDWKKLRNQLVQLCRLHWSDFLCKIKCKPATIEIFIVEFWDLVIEDINNRTLRDKIGIWNQGLSLFFNRTKFINLLVQDQAALSGNKRVDGNIVKPEQALVRKLCQFFEMSRRELIASEMGVSSNKVKTWERLDRLSRKVAEDNATLHRCTDDHFNDVALYVKKNHGHDKNLPRKDKTVKGYFYRFSKECEELIDDKADTVNKISLNEAKELMQGVGVKELSRCLDRLSPPFLNLIDAAFHLGLSNVQYRTTDDYLVIRGMTRKDYDEQLSQVLNELGQCLETSLVARQSGGNE